MTNENSIDSKQIASRGSRILAYIIDISLFWFISLFTIIPVLGSVIDLGLLFYMLLRDVTGASIGKRVIGLRVMNVTTGAPASIGQCIARNFIFAIPLFVEWIPVVGFFVGNSFMIVLGLVELVMLLSMGRRLGDYIAGTTVATKL
jgi:uncharacterized RDD family membrane protein YckC